MAMGLIIQFVVFRQLTSKPQTLEGSSRAVKMQSCT